MPDGKPALTAANMEIECVVEAGAWGPEETLQRLAEEAVAAAVAETGATAPLMLSILFTDDDQIQELNARFRGKDKPTNVLSFPAPAAMAPPGEPRHLGDIALAYGTVAREAQVEGKPFDHHLTHLVIHGFLHLLGYDHEGPQEADEMEELERQILQSLAIGDPYA